MPLWLGGEPYGENIVAACFNCNRKKGPLTEVEFLVVHDDEPARKRAIQSASARAENRSRQRVKADPLEVAESFARVWEKLTPVLVAWKATQPIPRVSTTEPTV